MPPRKSNILDIKWRSASCEHTHAVLWTVGLLYFSVLSDISFASFTGSMHACDTAIHAGFVSHFQSLQVPI